MHELGIVYHIIRDVENVARAHGVRRVSSVTLLLGEVSGVVPDLLLDAWRWAADKKPITEGAELIVEPVEAVTHCEACGCDYTTVEHIPPGTVIGDGHIKIAHVRIDTRLLHGQVATTWTKQINPNRIIVVSDGVAHDELRKTMIEQAAPPGVHANVVPIKKMAEVVKDTRFGDTKAMLLFENPQDLLKAIEAGVDIKEVNIGSMAHSKGKVVVTNAVAMGDDDVKTLEALKAKGVKFEVRKVPSDASEDLDAMLKKAKAELAAQA